MHLSVGTVVQLNNRNRSIINSSRRQHEEGAWRMSSAFFANIILNVKQLLSFHFKYCYTKKYHEIFGSKTGVQNLPNVGYAQLSDSYLKATTHKCDWEDFIIELTQPTISIFVKEGFRFYRTPYICEMNCTPNDRRDTNCFIESILFKNLIPGNSRSYRLIKLPALANPQSFSFSASNLRLATLSFRIFVHELTRFSNYQFL